MTPIIIALFVSTSISSLVAVFAWRRRPTTGATASALLMCGAAIWSIGYALEIVSPSLTAKLFWAKVQYLGIVATPTAMLIVAIQYSGRTHWLTQRRKILLAIEPTLIILLVWTNDSHGLIWQKTYLTNNTLFALGLEYGWMFWFNVVYSYLLLLGGVWLLFQTFLRPTQLYRTQAGVMLSSTLMPWIANLLYQLDYPIPGLDLTPIAFTLTGLGATWGFLRAQLFDITPVAHYAVIENMSDSVIVTDQKGRIVDINPAAQLLLHLSEAQVIGKTTEEVLADWPSFVHQPVSLGMMNEIFTLGDGDQLQYFYINISPLHSRTKNPTGQIIVLRDITEIKWVEAEMRKLNQAVEQSANSVIITTTDGTIEYVNPAFEQISGYTSEEVIGEHTRILKSGQMPAELYEDLWSTITSGKDWRGEITNRKKSGELYWEMNTISPIKDENGNITHYVAIKEDISARKQMEAELVVARDQALEANRLKSQLLTNISHDMRTPLGAIVGYTEMLRTGIFGSLTTEQDEKLQDILISCNQLSDFTNNLLAQSELRSGKLHLKKRRVTPQILLRESQSVLGLVAEQKGLQLNSEIAPEIPEQLLGDYYWLRRILSNLVNNAIKYTDEGSIDVRLFTADPNLWVMQVTDTGVGISEEARSYIFEPFRKGDEATVGYQRSGAGLGLSIVREIVEQMEGVIELESQVGKGTTFRIYLPLYLPQEEEPS